MKKIFSKRLFVYALCGTFLFLFSSCATIQKTFMPGKKTKSIKSAKKTSKVKKKTTSVKKSRPAAVVVSTRAPINIIPRESMNVSEEEESEIVEAKKHEVTGITLPAYISTLPNINDYDLLANSGWDSNWYVGYNVCWIINLPVEIDSSIVEYSRAFIGAKLGRAKSQPAPNKASWEKESILGDVYIAISQQPAWPSGNRYFLVSTLDIPLEGDPNDAIQGTGESRWFWAEIPIEEINLNGQNYIALWSDTPGINSRKTAPILCGGLRGKNSENRTWINNDIEGSPPIDTKDSLKTPISVFEPAIAIKLVPVNSEQAIKVKIEEIISVEKDTNTKIIECSITGNQIQRSWLEVMAEPDKYMKIGKYLYGPPYMFTFDCSGLPEVNVTLRAGAEDVWANIGYSPPVEVERNPK